MQITDQSNARSNCSFHNLQPLIKKLVSAIGSVLVLVRIRPVTDEKVKMLEWLLVGVLHSQPTILSKQLQCMSTLL